MSTFQFNQVAHDFDAHINDSIPGYSDLLETVLHVTPSFLQKRGKCHDLGCSTGSLLKQIEAQHATANLIGYDVEPAFKSHWDRDYLHVADITTAPLDSACIVICLFTLQFLDPSDRQPLLERIHASMLPGGALIIAEKVHFSSGRIQDLATTVYYGLKRRTFSADDILSKGMALVPVMRPSTSEQIEQMIRLAGFETVEQLWQRYHFRAWVAVKGMLQNERGVCVPEGIR